MTIGDAITRVDRLRPNAYERGEKIRWLSDLDGKLYLEIMRWHEGMPSARLPKRAKSPIGWDGAWQGYDPEGSLHIPLLAKAPYDDIYIHWLYAQMDYHSGETARYQNSMIMFNTAYATFADHYNRTHPPLQNHHIRSSMIGRDEPSHRGEGGHFI